MPLRFWKKEKPEKGKEEPAEKPKGAPPAEEAPTPTPEAKPAEPAAPAKPADLASVIGDVHAALVDLGLTVPATRTVFEKRIGSYPGGGAAFLSDYRAQPYRAVTKVLADWLGFRVPEAFEP